MVEGDDGCGFGKAIALNDDPSEVAPILFEFGIERGSADDTAPELHAEEAVGATVAPPAPPELLAGRGRDERFGSDAGEVFLEDFEDFGDGDEDGDAPDADVADDFGRVVAALKDNCAPSMGGMKRAMAWPEHMAQREKVQKADGREGAGVLAVFEHLALDGDDVGEDVGVGDNDAFGFGGGPGGEEDLDRVAGVGFEFGAGERGGPVERGEFPDGAPRVAVGRVGRRRR